MTKKYFSVTILLFIILYLFYWKLPQKQLGDIFNLSNNNTEPFNILKNNILKTNNQSCNIQSGYDQGVTFSRSEIMPIISNQNTNKPDLIISKITLDKTIPAYINTDGTINLDSKLVDMCGVIYTTPEKLIEANKKTINCNQKISKALGAVGTNSFIYKYIITLKNIGTAPAYYASVGYQVVDASTSWDFGFTPWKIELDSSIIKQCSDPIPINLNYSINKIPETMCNKKFCGPIDRVIARNNYCMFITHSIKFKGAYDDIKSFIIASSDYQKVETKNELDSYLENLAHSIKSLYQNCFPDEKIEHKWPNGSAYSSYTGPGRRSIICNDMNDKYGEMINSNDFKGTMDISGANAYLTSISMDINRFRGNDTSGIYKGIPISSGNGEKTNNQSITLSKQDGYKPTVIEKIDPRKSANITVIVIPPLLQGGSGQICQPNIGYWFINSLNDEITKNNNYDIARVKATFGPNILYDILEYTKSNLLTGDSSSTFNILGSDNHYSGFTVDSKSSIAPQASMPSISCRWMLQ